MSRGLSSTLKTELAKSNFAWAFLAKLEFNSTYYFTTAQHDLNSGGNPYLSSGMLIDLSEIGEESGISTGGITLTLSAAATSLMTDLLTNGHLHRQVTVSLALLNSSNAIIDSAFELYRGRVESMSIRDKKKTSTLELGIANHWADFDRSNGRSTTDNSQQQKFSGDKGFEFIHQSTEAITWGGIFHYQMLTLIKKRKWAGSLLGWVTYYEKGYYTESKYDALDSPATAVEIEKIPLIYGTHTVPGSLVYQEVSQNGKFLYECHAICEGPVASVAYANDPAWNSTQESLIDSYLSVGSTDAETFPTWMTDAPAATSYSPDGGGAGWGGPAWTSDHQLKGVAFGFFRHEFVWGQFESFPAYEFTVGGIAITGNDTNPALILKDYLTSTTHGAAIAAGDIDADSFTAAAVICDVENSGVKKHECSIVLDTSNSLVDNAKAILQTCNGELHWSGGKYRMHINDEFSGTPTVAFDASKMLTELEVRGESKRDRATQVISKWINGIKGDEVAWPDANDESSIYAAHLAADNDVALVKDINLRGVTNYHQARYLAKQHCLRSRNALRVEFGATAEALELTPGDVVTISHDTPSWTAKEFRVESVQIGNDLSVGVSAVEHQDSHYTWDSVSDPDVIPDTNRPAPTIVSAPTNFGVVEELYSTRDGAGVKTKAVVSWTLAVGGNVDQYEVGHKLSADSEYIVSMVTVDTTTTDVLDLTPGAYDFRVAAINEIGSKSSYISGSLTIGGLPAKPSTPTNLVIQAMSTIGVATWDQSDDLDVVQGGKFEMRHNPETTGSNIDWNEGTTVALGIPGHATSWTVPLLNGTYMIRAIDSTNQESDTGYFVSDGASIQPLAVVGSVTEEPLFAGTHYRTAAPYPNRLLVDSVVQIDDVPATGSPGTWYGIDGVADLADWAPPRQLGVGTKESGPAYTFANTLDTGSVQTVRLRLFQKSFVTKPSPKIDNWTDIDSRGMAAGNISGGAGWSGGGFDGLLSGYATSRTQMRKTNDDPAGSPTWGDWENFYVTEKSGRAFQFRTFPEINSQYFNYHIEQLRVYAEQLTS